MREKLIKNSLSGVVQLVITTLLTFVTVPIFIRMLGLEYYGIFAVISVVGSLSVFAHLGLNSSLIKFIGEQGKTKESNYDIVVTLIVITSIIVPLTILAVVLHSFVLKYIFNIPGKYFNDAKWLYYYLLIANMFLLLGQTFSAILDSQQKIYITNFIQLGYKIVYWVMVILILLLGNSLKEIGLISLVTSVLWFIIIMSFAKKEWGKLNLKGLKSNIFRIAKKQISYGSQIYAAGLVGQFFEPLTKIMIARFIGITEVGFFDITLKIKGQLWSLIGKIFYPIFPLIAQISERNKIRFIIHDLEQKSFYLIMPVVVCILICSKSFITLWIGKITDIISLSVTVITSSYLLGITLMPNYFFLTAKGYASKTVLLQLINVIVNLLLFFLLKNMLGYYAVIISFSSAIIASFSLSLYYQKKYLDSLIFNSFSHFIKTLIIFFIELTAGYFLSLILKSSWLILFVIPIAMLVLSIILYTLFKVFKGEDIVRYIGNNKLSKFGIRTLVKE